VIEAAVARGVLDPAAWDFVFIGRGIPAVRFGQGAVQPRRLETLRWSEYAELAGQVDLALSLMYTPHPSYPPFDLAASGAVVVTNRFANKQDLGGYCRNILCSDLDLQAMLDTLAEGVRLAQSPERQANHAASTLGRSWAEALAPVIARHA
jgi:hypothetical protein